LWYEASVERGGPSAPTLKLWPVPMTPFQSQAAARRGSGKRVAGAGDRGSREHAGPAAMSKQFESSATHLTRFS
jgi:hypothetical protein